MQSLLWVAIKMQIEFWLSLEGATGKKEDLFVNSALKLEIHVMQQQEDMLSFQK